MDVESFCDITLDHQITKINEIKRLPWIGNEYSNSKSKLLLLGESAYNWSPNDPTSLDRINEPMNLRKIHLHHAMDFSKKSKFVRNIEKAIFNSYSPLNAEKNELWNSVVYHNLVTRVMKTVKKRPSQDDYYKGWETFAKLIDVIRPKQVLVYGLEIKKITALHDFCKTNDFHYEQRKIPTKVGKSFPRVVNITIDQLELKILFIRHPSAYFSWKKWAPIIESELDI